MGVDKDPRCFSLAGFFDPLKGVVDLPVISHAPCSYMDVHAA